MGTPEPRLSARGVRPLVSGLRALGQDPKPLLAAAFLDEALLRDPDALVPMSVVVALLTHAVDVSGDVDLGLHLAEQADLGSFDVHFYAMLSSPTLGAAYERLCRYQRLIHETTHVELEVTGERATLRHRMPGGLAAPRQSAEFLLAAWVRAGRVITGTDWAPLAVRFAHPPPPRVTEHERVFRAPTHFAAGENALVLPRALLDTPTVHADESLLGVLDRCAADRLERVPRSSRLADRARAALAEELAGGDPSAARLAAGLRVSLRTLNRGLAAEGTSYRRLLDQLRHERAVRHLADDRLSLSEIAFLLGFSEMSAFSRAFRRWTGRPPTDFRTRPRPRLSP